MPYEIKTILRNDLCIVNTDSIDLHFIAFALSKNFNAIYIEKNHQLKGYLDLSKPINIFFNQPLNICTDLATINYNQYMNSPNKEDFFKNTTHTFIPIINGTKLSGELVKSSPPPSFIKIHFEIIPDDVYTLFFNNIGYNILFSTLDERTHMLYSKLEQLGAFQLTYYKDNVSPSTPYDVVIFHSPNHDCKSYTKGHTVYATIDYIYKQLLMLFILSFYKKNNISLYYIQFPASLNELPKIIKDSLYPHKLSAFAEDTAALDKYYGDNANRDFFKTGDYKKVSVIDNGLRHCLKDCRSATYNVVDGKRITTNSPTTYINSIHCFGPCIVRGGYVCDNSTICSYLQSNINAQHPSSLRVINYGVEGGINSIYDLHNMISAYYRKNDIVLIFGKGPCPYFLDTTYKINIIDTMTLYEKAPLNPPTIINSIMHVTHTFNELLANYIFKNLNLSNHLQNKTLPQEVKMNTPYIPTLSKEFSLFKKDLIKYRITDYTHKKIGAIVMNCNPFTLGHLYLVEESLKHIDHLYIFIVEEDKSFFSFSDRYQLAKSCCTHLKNVTILPSGKFIISTLTFPEYFVKDQLQKVTINPSKDVEIFGREIAPMLNITYRFLGEEPLDKVTSQYNTLLKEQLKWFNIQVIEIPRKSTNNVLISASLVRKLINAHNIEATQNLLPPSTYNFIEKKFLPNK